MHPHLDELRTYAGGEADVLARRRVAEHVLACTECRGRLQWLDDVRAAAAAPVPPPPADTWERIAARVAAGEAVLLPADDTAAGDVATRDAGGSPDRPVHRRRFELRGWRVAAAALLLAAGAAAAAPQGWLRSVLQAVAGAPGREAPLPAAADDDVDVAAASVALLIEPANGMVRVSLQQPHAGVRVHVRLTDDAELSVEAQSGAAAATFRTSPGRLEMVGGDSGAVVLMVPRSLGRVQVDVEGRPLLVKERGEIRILAPSADTIGSEFVLPVRAPSGAHRR